MMFYHSITNRRFGLFFSSMLLILATAGGGCLVEEDGSELYGELADELNISSLSQEFTTWRNDQNGIIIPGEGYWGEWKQRIFCNPGMWAIGYRMRVEGSQGKGDDTALNSVQLYCRNPSTGATESISSYNGIWGAWHGWATCSGSGNYLNGASIRIEHPQGGGDDTAANNVQFSCSLGGTAAAPGGMGWGTWSLWHQCPINTAVCGLSIRFESSQGGGDDTAMNGLELACCNLP